METQKRRGTAIKAIMNGIVPGASDYIQWKVCPLCKAPIDPDHSFTDELSRTEFGISGMCQSCQDRTFGTSSDDEDHMPDLVPSDVEEEKKTAAQ